MMRQRSANHRLIVFVAVCLGYVASLLGSQLTSFALGVWVFQRTGSATQFALISMFAMLPGVVISPLAGALVDRWDRRWILILSDTVAALVTLSVAGLLFTNRLEIWYIYLATMINSVSNAFFQPAFTASTTLLVHKRHYGRANGMVQAGSAVAYITAPVVAGALVLTIQLWGVLLIDFATFLVAVISLLMVRIPRPQLSPEGEAEQGLLWQEAAYGWKYITARPGLLGLLVFFAVTNFIRGIVQVLLTPLVLGFADSAVLGRILGAGGVGALLGGIVMSIWGGPRRRMFGILGFTLLQGTILFLGGLQPNALLIATAAAVVFFGSQMIVGCSQAVWQSKVAPDVQGRVFATRIMIAWSSLPAAYLVAGPLADYVFEPLLAVDGPLSGNIGQIVGVGPGRGIGLLYIILGILTVLTVIGGYLYPRLRLVEIELQDAMIEDAPREATEDHTFEKEGGKLLMGVTDKKRKKGNRVRKWLAYAGIALLTIGIILAGVGAWFVRRPWPKVNGTITISDLEAPVEVIRDRGGVPHIYAQNEHDLFLAQGYVHAQDRLWQMELNRRIGNGTLSQVVGKSALDLDRLMRTLGLCRVAERSWAAMNDDARSILEAYARGVNVYIETHQNRLPLEFTILGIKPEPWTPVDTLVWGNVMALNLGGNRRFELLRAQINSRLGQEAVQQLFPFYNPDTPMIIPAQANGYDWLQDVRSKDLTSVSKWLGNADGGWGSNNWVVHGSRTDSGKPILANDMHLLLQMPSVWYENGLHGGRFDSVGFSFPGVPLIIVGHNQHIAWGITNLEPDVQDFYLERLDDSENPTQYEFMGEWRDLEIIQETIKVKGSDPVPLRVLLTQHGPIVNDVFLDIPDNGEPISLRWTLFEGNRLFESVMRLGLATNWDEFRAALHDWDTPGQNFVYADVEGNTGYQTAGKIPIRVREHQGVVPVPGWAGEYEWQGFIPFNELPSTLNPETGFVATANNKVVPDDYPYLLTHDWAPGYRAKQITALLSADDLITIKDTQDIQANTYSLPAEILRPYLTAVEPENGLQAQALAHVKAWDLNYEIDRVGTSVYETWYLFLLRNTVGDELGSEQEGKGLADDYELCASKHQPMMIELMSDAHNPWFDDVNTPAIETRDDIVRRSLADAVAWLSERYGKDANKWTWGRIHTVSFVHQPLGQSGISLLERLFNSRTIPARGGRVSVNVAAFRLAQPFKVTFGTSQRMIVDLSDWDNSLAINTTGQSGHLFHFHREDLISMWQNVEYHPMFFAREAVEANAEAVLMLAPK